VSAAGGEQRQAEATGAKHKIKEQQKNLETSSQGKASTEPRAASSAKAEPAGKDKKQKEPLKDENGNELKRPQTAYMLFNNYRRPILRNEHPGKSLFSKLHT
jgi:hypothetical protein